MTLVEAGYFRTKAAGRHTGKIPNHPAYTRPGDTKGSNVTNQQPIITGDPIKVSEAMYRLVSLADPPLRLLLGQDALQRGREKIDRVVAEMKRYESWSQDLNYEHPISQYPL